MKTSLKNPCLECDHHLAGKDKNCEKCKNCEKRLEYVHAIDTSRSSSVSEHVDLEGHGGADPKSKENLADKDPIEKHIRSVCQTHGITVEKLRAGTKGKKDPDFQIFRDSIIRELASGKFGKLSQEKIGEYLNLSGHTVHCRMKIMEIKPMRPRSKKAAKKKAPKTKPMASATTPPDKKVITLALDDHPALYDDLLKLANKKLRTIENQALYILLQVQKRGMPLENTQA
jgi:hypothetical protein